VYKWRHAAISLKESFMRKNIVIMLLSFVGINSFAKTSGEPAYIPSSITCEITEWPVEAVRLKDAKKYIAEARFDGRRATYHEPALFDSKVTISFGQIIGLDKADLERFKVNIVEDGGSRVMTSGKLSETGVYEGRISFQASSGVTISVSKCQVHKE